MAASRFLAELRASGFTVRAEPGRLFVAPADRLTTNRRDAIARQRDDLITACLDPDDRVICADCIHARGAWCAAHPRSGLQRGYIGGIVTLPQRCGAWKGAAA